MQLSFWRSESFSSSRYGDSCNRYVYKRYTIPTWKRRGILAVIISHTKDLHGFSDRRLYGEREGEGWSYKIYLLGAVTGHHDVVEEVFYNGETLGGVMFYADLKAIELGYSLERPFAIPTLYKRERYG